MARKKDLELSPLMIYTCQQVLIMDHVNTVEVEVEVEVGVGFEDVVRLTVNRQRRLHKRLLRATRIYRALSDCQITPTIHNQSNISIVTKAMPIMQSW